MSLLELESSSLSGSPAVHSVVVEPWTLIHSILRKAEHDLMILAWSDRLVRLRMVVPQICDFSDMAAMLGQRLDARRVDEGVLVFDPAKDLLSAKGDNVFSQAMNKCVVPVTVDEQALV